MRLVVTRPREQARAWVQQLQGLGVDAVALPLIEIAPPADTSAVIRSWLGAVPTAGFAMFVSANAVQQFFALRPTDAAWPPTLRAGATGPGTVRALLQAGVPQALIDAPADDAPRWDSEALWARIADRPWAGASVLVLRGQDGRDWLAEQWRERGAQLRFVETYRRLPPAFDEAESVLWQQLQATPQQALWHFSASEALRALATLQAQWPGCTALVTHERMQALAAAMGFAPVHVLVPTVEAAAAAWRGTRAASASGRPWR